MWVLVRKGKHDFQSSHGATVTPGVGFYSFSQSPLTKSVHNKLSVISLWLIVLITCGSDVVIGALKQATTTSISFLRRSI